VQLLGAELLDKSGPSFPAAPALQYSVAVAPNLAAVDRPQLLGPFIWRIIQQAIDFIDGGHDQN
jgi:hypothetical protein